MPAQAPQPAQDRWCDIDGTHIALFRWVEQVAESMQRAALPSRLHQRGEVVGRGLDLLSVRFEDHQLVSLPPHMLRLLPNAPGEC